MTGATWLEGIHHVGCSITDIERSVAFWQRLLGVEARFRGRLDRPYLGESVGYPGVAVPADFATYIKKCQIDTTFFFADVNDRTVQQNLRALRVQAGVAHFIEKHQGRSAAEIQKAFQQFLKTMHEMPAQVGGHHRGRALAERVSAS